MQLILSVMKTYFLQFSRNRISVVLLIIFPMFFLFIFNIGFGGAEIGGSVTYTIAIHNEDKGIDPIIIPTLPDFIRNWADDGVGANLTEIISTLTYNDSDNTLIFDVVEISPESLADAVKDGDITVALTIPANYSMMVMNQINNIYGNQSFFGYPTDINATFGFVVDANNIEANIPVTILQQVIESFHTAIDNGVLPQVTDIQLESVLQGDIESIFDFIASGLLVFASILSASYFGALLLSDQEHRTIQRIHLSPIQPYEYITGFILFSFLLILVQFVVLLLSAVYLFGFDPAGSLLRGYVILILTSLPMYALVFTAGALFKRSDTAGNALGFSSSLIGFASNAFFSMPDVTIIPKALSFTSGNPDFLLWDIVPWTHAVNAMRTVMLFDQSLMDVVGDLMMLVVSSVIWLGIALVMYSRSTFRMED